MLGYARNSVERNIAAGALIPYISSTPFRNNFTYLEGSVLAKDLLPRRRVQDSRDYTDVIGYYSYYYLSLWVSKSSLGQHLVDIRRGILVFSPE